MEREATEVLSALVDGEGVDPDDLARALEAPEARSLLVDFVRLRRAVRDGAGPEEAVASRLGAGVRRRATAWRATRAVATAAVLLLALVGVLSLGGVGRGPAQAEAPPRAAREIHFEPGINWRPVDGGRR